MRPGQQLARGKESLPATGRRDYEEVSELAAGLRGRDLERVAKGAAGTQEQTRTVEVLAGEGREFMEPCKSSMVQLLSPVDGGKEPAVQQAETILQAVS